MFAHCRGPIWRRDDFSQCFEQDFLQTLFPLVVCSVSAIYLSLQVYRAARDARHVAGYHPVNSADPVWDTPVSSNDPSNAATTVAAAATATNGSPSTNPDFDSGSSTAADDASGSNEQLAIHSTPSKQDHQLTTVVNKPRGEFWLVALEELAVLGEVGIHLTAILTGAWGKKGRTAAIASCAVWVYICVLASLRLLFSGSRRFSFPRLWYHTAFIYGFQWVFIVLLFRSVVIHPKNPLSQKLMSADFALNSLLFVIALTSRKGNKAVVLEYEGNLEPSKEQTASVLSLATFAWVDKIVWKGYWKTYELSDVWNLPQKDKAANILADYRQVKKTTILAWHLLKYFKRGLLIQAGWACISGFLTFAPTMLLKAILEYVETPEATPRNAAWFYVILLFLSGCFSALADGQALWIGRKICIRLRAVIVGELYAKALKRKASAGSDKVLGSDKDKKDEGNKDGKLKGLKRMMSFGRKKKTNSEEASQGKKPTKKAADNEEGQVSSGAIINLMAVDSFKVAEISAYLHFLWANTPVQVVIAIFLLYRILGYSSIAGIGMMALLLPVNMIISQRFAKIQKLILAATDARIHTTNEVLSNIRIIKFFAWEQRFMNLVNEKRAVELAHLRHRYTWWAIAATVWSGAPVLITFLSFFVYTVIEKKPLVPSVAFTALSLFQILRIPLDQLADMVAHVQESKVSVDRIEEYLNEPETEKYQLLENIPIDEHGDPLIGFDNATFTWGSKDQSSPESSEAFKMIDLDFNFRVGQLNVIVGPTGSGKTSLLLALLGEMTSLKGKVFLPGAQPREELKPDRETGLTESVAYCAQQAWLVNATIKENILFASPFDPKRYKEVLIACSLQRDLEILDAGDQTLVGEKGVTLSGGQKQRISLARALYSKARHVLLDDVLSAVDAHTAKWIFNQALLGPLMYNRTCLLVTHNVSLCLPHADFAVVLDNGKVAAQGDANDVIDSGKLAEDLSKSRPVSRGPSRIASRVPSNVGGEEATGENGHASDGGAHGTANGSTDGKKMPASNTNEEKKAEGGVKLNIILLYLASMGPWWYWIIAACSFAAQQIASVATNVWIREWANAYASKQVSVSGHHHTSSLTHISSVSGLGTCLRSGTCAWGLPWLSNNTTPEFTVTMGSGNDDINATYYLTVYAALGVVFMFITLSRECVLFSGSLTASRGIHTRLMDAITHAKFRFFDSTPLGQLMNRFSKDIEAVDQEVAPVAVGVVHCLASIVTIVILISVITPAFLISGIFISILYFLIAAFYLRSSVDLKRLESVQRSPLYQQFGETLSGMTTIRAYGDERRFIRENLNRINTQSRPFIYLWAANRWLAFRVDVVGALVSFFAGVFVISSIGKLDAGAAGLALTYAVTFTENVLWFVRLYSANEQNMNSVERIKEYLDVEQEAAPIVPDNRPPGNWPSKGSVEFISYSARYRLDFDLVLKSVTFKIQPGEKVGVVGRTGAGKSSLAMALFRALEAEQGKILVDDVDIGLIGLQDLRESIVMVPQDPTLFTGTVRSNLDPFNLFTDEEIFNALRRVQLIGSVHSSLAGTPREPGTPRPTTELDPLDIPNPNPSGHISATTHPGSIIGGTTVEDVDINDDEPILTIIDSAPIKSSGVSDSMVIENKNLFQNLSSPVTESGSNLSQGQRQLLCLARALLKDPKILLMDEATASIDHATDAKIQETIREIKNTTITIAHRLQTIIDYDKVLVLDKGEVVEYGDPWDLIKKEDGSFRSMCQTSGDLEDLEKEAKKAWEGRRLVDDS